MNVLYVLQSALFCYNQLNTRATTCIQASIFKDEMQKNDKNVCKQISIEVRLLRKKTLILIQIVELNQGYTWKRGAWDLESFSRKNKKKLSESLIYILVSLENTLQSLFLFASKLFVCLYFVFMVIEGTHRFIWPHLKSIFKQREISCEVKDDTKKVKKNNFDSP